MNAASAVAARAVAWMVSLCTIALVTRSLGAQRYGVVATITALAGVLQIADLGVSNGLVTNLAGALGRGDTERARRLISATSLVLLLIAGGIAALASAVAAGTSLARLIGIPSDLVAVSRSAVTVFVVLVIVGIPLAVVQSVEEGLQAGVRRNGWAATGSIVTLCGVVTCAHFRSGMGWVMVSVSGGPVIGLLGNALHVFWRHRGLRPTRARIDKAAIFEVLRAGRLFFVLQGAVAIGYETDAIIVAHVLGPGPVASYALGGALFFPIMGGVAVVVRPFWAAYADAIAAKDFEWVRGALKRSLALVAIITCGASALVLLLADRVVALLVGGRIHVSADLLVSFSIWTVVGSMGTAVAMLLNAVHLVRPQVISAAAMAVVNLVLSIYLCRTLGTSGVVWGSVISYVGCIAVPLVFIVPNVLANVAPLSDAP